MVKVEALESGWLVANMAYFGEATEADAKLKLITTQGDHVRYGTDLEGVIDFPGEYDVNNITVKGWLAGGLMSYLIKTERASIGLVSNSAALDVGSFDEAEDVLCMNQETADEAEKMELTGKIQLFEAAAAGEPAPAVEESTDEEVEEEAPSKE